MDWNAWLGTERKRKGYPFDRDSEDIIVMGDPILRSDILAAVEETTGVEPLIILGRRRSAEIVTARHVAIRLAQKVWPRCTPGDIARAFKRDHSTVYYVLSKGISDGDAALLEQAWAAL